MSTNIAEERRKLYKNSSIARLIAFLIQMKSKLKPEYDPRFGFRYPEAERIVNEDPEETKAILRRLAELQVLKEKFAEMSLQCPSCGSAEISTLYICPHCESPRISRNALIEHIACGYIDNIAKFRTDGELVCPKCRATLNKGSYRNAGSWYECNDCGKRVELLKVTHKCRKCNVNFLFDEARYIEFYSYSLNPDVISEVKMGVLFSTLIKDVLSDLKVKVKVPGVIKGRSGANHQFDALIRTSKGKIIALDALISSRPIEQSEISSEYGKIIDSEAEAYIIASPSVDEDASKLVKAYNMKVLEGELLEALKMLKNAIKLESERK